MTSIGKEIMDFYLSVGISLNSHSVVLNGYLRSSEDSVKSDGKLINDLKESLSSFVYNHFIHNM